MNRKSYIGEENPNFKAFYCFCRQCGKRFTIQPNEYRSGKKKGIFCSRNCWKKFKMLNKMPIKMVRFKKDQQRRLIRHLKDINYNKKWPKRLNNFKRDFGYTAEDFRKYITSRLKEGMNLNNYGEWVIDHIIPVLRFRFTTFDDSFRECFKLNNLQPLWWKENELKGRR